MDSLKEFDEIKLPKNKREEVKPRKEFAKVKPLKDFEIKFNEHYFKLEEGIEIEIPKMFLQNLKTEKIIKN